MCVCVCVCVCVCAFRARAPPCLCAHAHKTISRFELNRKDVDEAAYHQYFLWHSYTVMLVRLNSLF